jgi:hypothetical protein
MDENEISWMKLSNDVTYGWHAINEILFFSLNKN